MTLLATAGPAHSGPTEIETIETLWQAPADAAPMLSQSFAAAVPADQIAAIISQVQAQTGAALSVTGGDGRYTIRTQTHEIPVELVLDDNGKIASLFIRPPQALTMSPAETLAAFEVLGDRVSYTVMSSDHVLFEKDADTAHAVGSTFKLGILKVLMDEIETGQRHWRDVVTLEAGDKSLPSGRLQTFPVGAPLTLHTLATLMIAESDNTATDVLIRVLGPAPIANELGIDTLLTTRAFFTIKADPALAERYREGTAEEKSAIAAEASGRQLPPASAVMHPLTEGVEWYLPVSRLCALIRAVSAADVFTLNPGPVATDDWQSIAYKGGSEIGVLNFTAALSGSDGADICVSITLNHTTAIDEAKAAGLFTRLTHQLSQR
ncbi:serine hydrolase [Martelella endophytica]|uniref:serine hydrolase n=1 Tax=Martelella endophytica TaxID=1486262 RepID=UPI0006960021|nr:serine hydrolase [Martelella endophytica]